MSVSSIGQDRGVPFSHRENDSSPPQVEQKKIMQEKIQIINDVVNHKLQTSLPENRKQDESPVTFGDYLRNLVHSAKNGNAADQFTLAMMYFNGTSIHRNCVEGEKWLTKAAKNGHCEAERKLHAMHFQGDGIADGYDS